MRSQRSWDQRYSERERKEENAEVGKRSKVREKGGNRSKKTGRRMKNTEGGETRRSRSKE
jgi:hypothetical protein